MREPHDLGGKYEFHVGPYDQGGWDFTTNQETVTTRWQVYLPHQCGTTEIADEDQPHKAAAKLRVFIAEAQIALTALEGLGVYRGDRPVSETPAWGVLAYCPAQPCEWHTTWDTPEEAAAARLRHIDGDHGGDPRPSPVFLEEELRRSLIRGFL